MAISEVAGPTISTAFAATQLNSSQRSAQQELQTSAVQAKAVGASGADAAQSVVAAASSGELNTDSTEYTPRGSRIDITV